MVGPDAVTVLKGQLGPRDRAGDDAKVEARKSLLFRCPGDRIFGHRAWLSSPATSGTKEWGHGGFAW